jgi:hypothetical protein
MATCLIQNTRYHGQYLNQTPTEYTSDEENSPLRCSYSSVTLRRNVCKLLPNYISEGSTHHSQRHENSESENRRLMYYFFSCIHCCLACNLHFKFKFKIYDFKLLTVLVFMSFYNTSIVQHDSVYLAIIRCIKLLE